MVRQRLPLPLQEPIAGNLQMRSFIKMCPRFALFQSVSIMEPSRIAVFAALAAVCRIIEP